MLTEAKFIGSNSLGYERNKVYLLKIKVINSQISIERNDGSGKCVYDSFAALMSNWTNIAAPKIKNSTNKTTNILDVDVELVCVINANGNKQTRFTFKDFGSPFDLEFMSNKKVRFKMKTNSSSGDAIVIGYGIICE